MGLLKFPNGVSSFGVPVIGSSPEIPVTTGNYFFVSSVTGNVTNSGKSANRPVATIAQALLKCTASKGDVIIVMPGHTETITGSLGININVAGVSIIGLGRGTLRPTVTFTTANTGTLGLSAANCSIKNFILNANYADIATAIIVSAAWCKIEDVYFKEHTTSMNFLNCVRTSAVANACDGLQIIGCKRTAIDAAAIAMISILEANDHLYIANNLDIHTYGANVGQFIILGAFDVKDFVCTGNVLHLVGDNSGQSVGNLITGSSTASDGVVSYNLVGGLDVGGLLDTSTLEFAHYENYFVGIAAKSGLILPAIS